MLIHCLGLWRGLLWIRSLLRGSGVLRRSGTEGPGREFFLMGLRCRELLLLENGILGLGSYWEFTLSTR